MAQLTELIDLHASQFSKMGMPGSLWRKAIEHIVYEEYLSSSYFTVGLIRGDEENNKRLNYQICASQDIDALDDVFLIDNWFTFPLRRLGFFLEGDINLLEKLEQLLGLLPLSNNQNDYANGDCSEIDERLPSERIDEVYKEMWKFVGSYSLNGDGNETVPDPSIDNKDELLEPVWYFMDHYGTHIAYTSEQEEVNVRICPFIFMPTMASYSMLWVTQPIAEGELIVREHTLAKNASNSAWKAARMLPWKPDETIEEMPPLFHPNFQDVAQHRNETLPVTSDVAGATTLPFLPEDKPVKVFNAHKDVSNYLNAPLFSFVYFGEDSVTAVGEDGGSDLEAVDHVDADVYFLHSHFKRFDRIVQMQKYVNQFPSEHLIHCKDLLAACVITRSLMSSSASANDELELPSWFQMTYNLHHDLPRFVYDWCRRISSNADSPEGDGGGDANVWILKPWNLSRGACSYVTNSLDQIIRMSETSVPLIAQKYIERPLTFYRVDKQYSVKFDMRVFVAVQSLVPLRAYVYNRYLARIANLEFKLKHFHEYERHFSSMGYLDGGRRCWYMPYETFRTNLLDHQPELPWDDLVNETHTAIREMIQCVTENPTIPSRAFQCEYSRALYGIDVMFKKEANDRYQPVILEVNFNPDSTMFSSFYPNFHNEYFQLLFMNKIDDENKFTKL